jgi:ribosome-associated translation inhibitor RaiA
MTFQFRSLVVKAASGLARQLKEQINSLRALIPIESAEAVLERISQPHGAFRLQVHLAVPGPDLRVESTGYTTQEALLKMNKELTRQIQMRRVRRRDERNLRRPLLGGK